MLNILSNFPRSGLRIRNRPGTTNVSTHEQTETKQHPALYVTEPRYIPKPAPLYTLDNPALYINTYHILTARGGAVRWGTALQAGRSRVRFPMVSLEFFIDIILPASTRNTSWGIKAVDASGWQPYRIQVPIVLKCGRSTSWDPQGQSRHVMGLLYLYDIPNCVRTQQATNK